MAYGKEGMDVAGRRAHNGLMDTTGRTGRMASKVPCGHGPDEHETETERAACASKGW